MVSSKPLSTLAGKRIETRLSNHSLHVVQVLLVQCIGAAAVNTCVMRFSTP